MASTAEQTQATTDRLQVCRRQHPQHAPRYWVLPSKNHWPAITSAVSQRRVVMGPGRSNTASHRRPRSAENRSWEVDLCTTPDQSQYPVGLAGIRLICDQKATVPLPIQLMPTLSWDRQTMQPQCKVRRNLTLVNSSSGGSCQVAANRWRLAVGAGSFNQVWLLWLPIDTSCVPAPGALVLRPSSILGCPRHQISCNEIGGSKGV